MHIKDFLVVHEFGHLAACIALGTSIRCVEFGEGHGRVVYENPANKLNQGKMILAGPIAEIDFLRGCTRQVLEVFSEKRGLRKYGVVIGDNQCHTVCTWNRDYRSFCELELDKIETQQVFDEACEIVLTSKDEIRNATNLVRNRLQNGERNFVFEFGGVQVSILNPGDSESE